jgi:phytoene synthase
MSAAPPATAPSAEEITRASKSNLALALVTLPRERRRDMNIFYAYCRIIDDIADDPGQSAKDRRAALAKWRESLRGEISDPPPLAAQVRALIAKYRLDPQLLCEIIAGCEMDLGGARYATWEDLRLYCHRVAACVGLVSIEIFGCRDPGCKRYAEALGLALQLTNILRDVGEDFANGGRVYLPEEDLGRFGVTVEDLAQKRRNEAFLALMRFETERARGFFREAIAALPPAERRNLVAAELMRAIYSRILFRMERDGFRVFEKRYRVSTAGKILLIARVLLRTALRG